ncbi:MULTISPECIES: transposase [Bradyrhizobium]|nr:transposase [Bradyrhizobium japonicum]
MFDHTLKSDVTARRLEVITETGRRRWFSKDDKARIVGETLVPGAVVSEIARRHGLTPQQVFTWRRQARRQPAPGDVWSLARHRASSTPVVKHQPNAGSGGRTSYIEIGRFLPGLCWLSALQRTRSGSRLP